MWLRYRVTPVGMILIYFVRHGETEWNANDRIQGSSDIPLNAVGREQALRAAPAFRLQRWDAVYSSPLSRAAETAQIICGEPECSRIIYEDRIQERSFGAAEGLTADQRFRRFPGRAIPGAESWEQLMERADGFMARLVGRSAAIEEDTRYLVITHGGFINAVLRLLHEQGIGPGRQVLANLSCTLVTWDGRWSLAWYNRATDSPAVECVYSGNTPADR